MCDYLSIGTNEGPLQILTGRDLAKMDKFEADLRGQWHDELKKIAHSITDEALRELASLVWFGRGDGPLAYCRKHAEEIDPHISYLLGKPLDSYLPAALIKLGLLSDDGGEA